ncbi:MULTISPECIES: DUF2023 family protein [Fusobacterium]|uniref:DUF2023 family protein n=1 Tax=Fusobacterium TaxID=848 RepID=UPI0027DD01B8|nr:DUF2023 family protein [Fusobacterium sp.]MDU1911204.1 DUF2023 family protein [Fusobacterium sp.]
MEVFIHHIYEYQKGIRNLILHTTDKKNIEIIKEKLNSENIDYIIYPLGKQRINVFFGAKECVEVIKNINKLSLTAYTPEEDFILGIMLGYDRKKQCERFLKFKEKAISA